MNDQSSYLDSERDLSRVRHLEQLEQILDQADVDKSDIILYGSSIMALCGIKPNNDLEFIPHPDSRSKFHELGKEMPNATIDEEGQIYFPGEVGALYKRNKFKMFDWDDYDLFEDDEVYIEYEGYKFLKLELLLSLKGVKRRQKDFEHMNMLEEQDLIGGQDWNWELVRRVPPWDRPESSSDSGGDLLEIGIHSVRNRGLLKTGLRIPSFLVSRLFNVDPGNSKPLRMIADVKNKWNLQNEIAEELETHYPAPDLLNRQFANGLFKRDDLIAAVLSIEDETPFEEYAAELEQISPSISPSGNINGGILQLANQWAEWEGTDANASTRLAFPIEVSSNNKLPDRGEEWAVDKFGPGSADMIRHRRQTLLANTGVYFYAILWPVAIEQHDEIEDWLSQHLEVVSSQELRLDNEIEDFARSVYSTDDRPFEWEKERKIKKISSDGDTVRVIAIRLSDPDFRSWDGPRLSNTIYTTKQDCRQEFQEKVDEYEYGALIHTTDNYVHNLHIASILTKFGAKMKYD
jgi:hypothetical protein